MKSKLEKISEKYSEIKFNEDNYSVGGGLSTNQFASNRHEDAKYDSGKLTLGKACQMFKKATGLELHEVKEIIKYAVPNMEWHHAGMLPKSYGGGMKKTYFLNASEIVNLANRFYMYKNQYEISIEEKRTESQKAAQLQNLKEQFLSENAVKVERVEKRPEIFYETNKEMNGKYGWFSSYGKSYSMTEYYTGWEFDSIEKYKEFVTL